MTSEEVVKGCGTICAYKVLSLLCDLKDRGDSKPWDMIRLTAETRSELYADLCSRWESVWMTRNESGVYGTSYLGMDLVTDPNVEGDGWELVRMVEIND